MEVSKHYFEDLGITVRNVNEDLYFLFVLYIEDMMEILAVKTEKFLTAGEGMLLIKYDIFFHLPMFFQFLHIILINIALQLHTVAFISFNGLYSSHLQK